MELGMKKILDTRNATKAIPPTPINMCGRINVLTVGAPELESASPRIIWITSPAAPIAPVSVWLFRLLPFCVGHLSQD